MALSRDPVHVHTTRAWNKNSWPLIFHATQSERYGNSLSILLWIICMSKLLYFRNMIGSLVEHERTLFCSFTCINHFTSSCFSNVNDSQKHSHKPCRYTFCNALQSINNKKKSNRNVTKEITSWRHTHVFHMIICISITICQSRLEKLLHQLVVQKSHQDTTLVIRDFFKACLYRECSTLYDRTLWRSSSMEKRQHIFSDSISVFEIIIKSFYIYNAHKIEDVHIPTAS